MGKSYLIRTIPNDELKWFDLEEIFNLLDLTPETAQVFVLQIFPITDSRGGVGNIEEFWSFFTEEQKKELNVEAIKAKENEPR